MNINIGLGLGLGLGSDSVEINNRIDCIETIETIDSTNVSVAEMAHCMNATNVSKRRRTRNRRSKKRKWLRSSCCGHSVEHNHSHNHNSPNLVSVRSCGQPLAPYNTTQFIINDHCNSQLDFDEIDGRIKRMHKTTINDSQQNATHDEFTLNDHNNDHNHNDYTSDDDDLESNFYLQQQFHEAYDNIHAERLNSMTKTELVDEYLQLEDRVEDLERRLKESRETRVRNTSTCEVQTETQTETLVRNNNTVNMDDSDSGTDVGATTALNDPIFRQQFNKLCEENERLRCDNVRLQRIVDQTLINTESNQ